MTTKKLARMAQMNQETAFHESQNLFRNGSASRLDIVTISVQLMKSRFSIKKENCDHVGMSGNAL